MPGYASAGLPSDGPRRIAPHPCCSFITGATRRLALANKSLSVPLSFSHLSLCQNMTSTTSTLSFISIFYPIHFFIFHFSSFPLSPASIVHHDQDFGTHRRVAQIHEELQQRGVVVQQLEEHRPPLGLADAVVRRSVEGAGAAVVPAVALAGDGAVDEMGDVGQGLERDLGAVERAAHRLKKGKP